MKLNVKNMVCNRCIMVVKQEFEKAGLKPLQIRLGEVELLKAPSKAKLSIITLRLKELGFEILDDHKQQQVEKIKTLLIDKIQKGQIEEGLRLSDFLGRKMQKDYSSISRLFSEVEGMTVEQFFIFQKIEKVKELLVYGESNLNEIAYQMGYSSTAHLSSQFKRITGLTSGHFKKIGAKLRKPLDQVGHK